MKRTENIRPKRSTKQLKLRYFLFGFLLFAMLANLSVFAQNGPVKNDLKNSADQNLKSTARVNPSTLAMEFSLPLMTYPGRNGSGVPVGFSYSSKLWRMESGVTVWNTSPGGNTSYVTDATPRFAERTAAGWSSSMQPPRIEKEEEIQLYDNLGNPYSENLFDDITYNSNWQNILNGFGQQNLNGVDTCGVHCLGIMTTLDTEGNVTGWQCGNWAVVFCEDDTGVFPSPPPQFNLYYIKRINVAMPDGSSQEFRQDDEKHPCGTNLSQCVPDLTGTFLAVNGSGMRLEVDTSGSTLFMPNGSKYLFTGVAQNALDGKYANEYVDVNGNKKTFSQAVNSNTGVTKWKVTDTLGREITDAIPHNWKQQTLPNGKEQIDLDGFNGTDLTYNITWSRLKPVGCEDKDDTDPTCQSLPADIDRALDDQSQKLYYSAKFRCGNPIVDLSSNGEVLFNEVQAGVRPCASFDVERDANGVVVIDGSGNAIPFPLRHNPTVISKIELPNGQSYEFKYNRYGEITVIIYPTGSYEEFDYEAIDPLSPSGLAFDQTNRGVKNRRVYSADGTLEQKTKYQVAYSFATGGNSTYDVTTTSSKADPPNPLTEVDNINDWGASSVRSLHSFPGNQEFGFKNPLVGRPKETKSYDEAQQLRSRTLTEYISQGPTTGGVTNAKRDMRASRSVSFTFEPGEAYALATYSKSFYDDSGSTDPEFFSHLNVKKSEGYEYAAIPIGTATTMALSSVDGWFPSGKLASVTETDYDYNVNYKENGVLGLTTEIRVLNPQNTSEVLAKTQSVYDEFNLLPRAATTGYVAPTGTHSDKRGNLTTQKLWDDDANNGNGIWLESHTEYDIYGNAFKTIDHQGRFATVEFDAANKFAYPIRTISPAPGNGTTGTLEEFKTETTYDFTTGLVKSVTDLRELNNSSDNLVTTTEYNDDLLRPTAVVAPNGARTETEYYDDPNPATNPEGLRVVTRSQFDTNVWNEAIAYADSLGRAYKTRTIDSNGDVIVETKFDNAGRPTEVSNPYREGTTEPILWSKTEYDAGGRVENVYSPVTDPDTTPGDPIGTTEYGIMNSQDTTGVWTISTDASGRKKRSVTNSKGQLVRVDEASSDKTLDPIPQGTPNPTPTPNPSPTPPTDPPSCYSGTASCLTNDGTFPSVSTYYRYNVKGEMVEVTQGDQKRNFLYDSLGRLIRVKQPEQEVNTAFNKPDPVTGNNEWTARMKYDVMGKVVESEDAKGTIISYTYDNADRVLSTTYSDGTPTVYYKYDLINGNLTSGSKGQLIETSNSISTSKTTAFDQWGRPTEFQQITKLANQTEFNCTAPPNVGCISKYKYNLSGALIEETYPSGRVVKNTFDDNGDVGRVYGKATSSSVEKTYANSFNYTASGGISAMKLGNGKWETAKFNNRLQVEELGLGNASQDASLLKINYDFGEIDASGNIDATMNTGNIARQTISFSGLSQPFVQTYKYDSLYRLKEANEQAGATENWKQNFTYDRYGNRQTHDKEINGNLVAENSQTHPTIDTNTNRFDTSQGYTYDKVGNLIVDGDGRTFTFDGNNKQTYVYDGNKTIGVYFYDGNGMRVKKERYSDGNLAETVIFVYSGGKLAEEFSTQAPTSPKTKYLTEDHLGTPRIITDVDGEVISRRDFLPFGEDITSIVGTRSTNGFQYATTEDDVRQKFTGYQKDEETGLDFAEARMYENRHARFTAVDPLLASGNSSNPQTFNRYVYVTNSPLMFTDPTGLIMDWVTAGGETFYDSGIRNEGQAKAKYGEDAVHHEDNTTILASDDVYYTLLNGGRYVSSTGVRHQLADRALTPTDRFGREFSAGIDAAIYGVPKGLANFGIDTVNSAKNMGFRCRFFCPPDIPSFQANNPREGSYMSAGETSGFIASGKGIDKLIRKGAKSAPSVVSKYVDAFPKKWANMTARERKFAQHALKQKKTKELGLPNFRMSKDYVDDMLKQFNKVVSHIRKNGTVKRDRFIFSPGGTGTKSKQTLGNVYNWTDPNSGKTYYVQELLNGKFVSAGLKTQ